MPQVKCPANKELRHIHQKSHMELEKKVDISSTCKPQEEDVASKKQAEHTNRYRLDSIGLLFSTIEPYHLEFM